MFRDELEREGVCNIEKHFDKDSRHGLGTWLAFIQHLLQIVINIVLCILMFIVLCGMPDAEKECK